MIDVSWFQAVGTSGRSRWSVGRDGKKVLTVSMPVTRKMRRAMTSRRWEKKAVKAINAMLGDDYPFPLAGIKKGR